MKKDSPQKTDSSDASLEGTVFRGLLAEGHLLPETADELRVAEAHQAKSNASLPPALDDPDAVLRRIQERIAERDTKTVPFPLPQATGVDEELSRAARRGTKLHPHIKAKMKKNRREADRKRSADGNVD